MSCIILAVECAHVSVAIVLIVMATDQLQPPTVAIVLIVMATNQLQPPTFRQWVSE